VAFFGAALAPALFAWGLQRVSATGGALLLNFEAVFTVALAAAIHREHVAPRVAVAALLMLGGGCVTVAGAAGASAGGQVGVWGAAAVVAAVLSWALDNVLTRPFADLDPAAVQFHQLLYQRQADAQATGLLSRRRRPLDEGLE